jgi:hypothetical protein
MVVRRQDEGEQMERQAPLSEAEDSDDDGNIRRALERGRKNKSGLTKLLPPMFGGAHLKVEGALRRREALPEWFANARMKARQMEWHRLLDWEEYMSVLKGGLNSALSEEIDRSCFNMLLYVCADEFEGELFEQDMLAMTCSRILYTQPLILLRFFNRMSTSGMKGSTRANFARTAKKATQGVLEGLIQVPADLKRNATSVALQLRRTIRELDTAKNRATIERRNPIKQKSLGNPRFVDLNRHEKVFSLARKKLKQLIALQEDTPMWRHLFICWFSFVLFDVPVRPSFFFECKLSSVTTWETEEGKLVWAILPDYEKSLGLQKTPRDYFFIPDELSEIFSFYMNTGRKLLLSGRKALSAPEPSSLLLNESGEPLPKARLSLWFRKCMWEVTRHLSKTDGQTELLTNLREYRFLFSVSVVHSDLPEKHKDFVAQQLRHSKTTVELYYNTSLLPNERPQKSRISFENLREMIQSGRIPEAMKEIFESGPPRPYVVPQPALARFSAPTSLAPNAGPAPSVAPSVAPAAAAAAAVVPVAVNQPTSVIGASSSWSVVEVAAIPSKRRRPVRVTKQVQTFSREVIAVATELKSLASSGNLAKLTERLRQLDAQQAFGGVLGLGYNQFDRLLDLITRGKYISDSMLEPFINDHPLPGGCEVMNIVLLHQWWEYDSEARVEGVLRVMIDRPPIRKMFFLGGGAGHFFPVWLNADTKKIYYYDSMGWRHDEFMVESRPALARLLEPLGWDRVQDWGIVRLKGPRQEECECLLITWEVIKSVASGKGFPESWHGWSKKRRLQLFVELMDKVLDGVAARD